MPEACRMLNVSLQPLGMSEVMARLGEFVDSSKPHQVVTVNLDFIRIARSDPAFRVAIDEADLAIADGMPLVWLSWLFGPALPERIAGIDLVDQAAALACRRGYSVFLLGAAPGVATLAAEELTRRHGQLRIAGTYAPPMGAFEGREDAEIVSRVRLARPDMLFVAFGAPRQDTWIHDHLDALQVPLCIGVGGSFNFLAGRQPRAPLWMQRSGLEWAHRLVHEPRRLWRRYLLGDLPVMARIAAAHLFPSLQ